MVVEVYIMNWWDGQQDCIYGRGIGWRSEVIPFAFDVHV